MFEKSTVDYNQLLEAYHEIGYQVWELPDQEEPLNLEEIVQEQPTEEISDGKTYLALNPEKVTDYVLQGIGGLVVIYKGNRIELCAFMTSNNKITVQENITKIQHTINLREYTELVKLAPILNKFITLNTNKE